jgi:hypothetical protein
MILVVTVASSVLEEFYVLITEIKLLHFTHLFMMSSG